MSFSPNRTYRPMLGGITLLAALAGCSSDATSWMLVSDRPATVAGVIASLAALAIMAREARQARQSSLVAQQSTEESRRQLDMAVEGLGNDAAPSLDAELGEVSHELSSTMARLHDISERARAYEEEVRSLVERGEAARATVALNEDAARKIALILGSESQARLKEEIDRLSHAHAAQVETLKRSGTRVAWITFVAGALVGFGGNILTSLIMS